MRKIAVLGTLLLALVASACAPATTKFKDSWKKPEFTGKVQKIYLIGVTRNDKLRKNFEDEFVKQFAQVGVTGIPSYPDLVISGDVDREALRAMVKAKGADAVLVGRLASKEQKSSLYSGSRAGYATGGPDGFYYDGFGLYNPQYAYRYYDQHYNGSVSIVTMNPVVEHQFQQVGISANLYETESAEVIWSALTETTVGDENSDQRLREFVQLVVLKMKEQGLF